MKIYLIQPGENDSTYLTEEGVWQINSLARRMINDRVSAERIYVNGHDISRQSGHILSKSLKIPVVSDERFVDVNKNVVLGEIDSYEFENLENITCFIDEIVNKGKDAIVVIGEGVHRVFISKLTGMPLRETRHFSLMHTGISVLEYLNNGSTGNWRMSLLNDRAHLNVP